MYLSSVYYNPNHGINLICRLWFQKIQQRWFEKMHDWEKALQAYEIKHIETPDDVELLLGRMRCMEALGEW